MLSLNQPQWRQLSMVATVPCQGSGYEAGEPCSCMASTCRTTSPLDQVVSL